MQVGLVYRGRYHVREALDLETYSAVLQRAGHRVHLFWDENTFGVTDNVLQIPWLARRLSNPQRLCGEIAAAEPDVLVFSVLPSTYRWAREVARGLKAHLSIPVVFMGFHPSMVPERCMRDAFVDYAIEGEVESAILPLLEVLEGAADPSTVGNLWYRRSGEVHSTFRAELVDLDALPLPDKDLFRPRVSHTYSYCAMVSRGCPYQCTFCEETCSKRLYGPAYFRRKSVDTIMRELTHAKRRYHFREVVFKDSYLSGNRPWLEDLMRRYVREIGVPFKCFCTVLGFDEATARLLKEGGCYNVEFGLQTWNESIRRDVLRRRETNAQARRAFDVCDRTGLWFDVDHMFNLPGETEADHIAGAREYHALRHLNRIKNHFLLYLPTAEIVAFAKRAGVLPPDVDEALAEGRETDFYGQETGDADQQTTVAAYAALYKVLPVLPKPLLNWCLSNGRAGWLRRVPGPLLLLLQAAIGLRSKDLRFAEYVQSYPKRMGRALRGSVNCCRIEA